MPRPFLLAMFLSMTIGVATAQSGELGPGDEQLETGEYFDVIPYTAQAAGTVAVTLSSPEFDVYLVVLDAAGEVLGQYDDSDGAGTDVREHLALPAPGEYLFGVTSARPGETGRYTLEVLPLQAANPLTAPPAPDFSGAFSDGGLQVILTSSPAGVTGTFSLNGQSFPASGTVAAGVLSGIFESGGQGFPFTATLTPEGLRLETGGRTYSLPRQASQPPQATNPLAVPATTAPATPPATPPTEALTPRPGYVVGRTFDTAGRPLAGAGVQITGTTFGQGERVSFETTTDAHGVYVVRVPDGRYQAKAWTDVDYQGVRFSRLLHPLSGNPRAEVDSTEGGVLDFEWRLSGLTAYSAPPGSDPADFHGASVRVSYCGLPAQAYCDSRYADFPARPIAPGGSQVELLLSPTGPLLDSTPGTPVTLTFPVNAQDSAYPYGEVANRPAGFESGGGRTTIRADAPYQAFDWNDIPVGTYELRATAVFPGGRRQALLVGLEPDDVEHEAVTITFTPWDGYQARSYTGGGLNQTTVYLRD